MRCITCGTEIMGNSPQCPQCQQCKTAEQKMPADLMQTPRNRSYKLLAKVSQDARQSGENLLNQRVRVATDKMPAVSPAPQAADIGNLLIAYLVCSPFAPIRLDRKHPVAIGRDKSNQLVLPSRDVSRFHAVVRWQQETYVLEDLDSSNGTFVNEDYIERHVLHDGDNIYIGTHTLFFREVLAGTAVSADVPDASLKDTVQIRLHPQLSDLAVNASSFQGDIASLGLLSILQMLGLDKKTGCLTITHEGQQGHVYFLEGVVIHCICADIRGRDAFLQLARWNSGQFTFQTMETTQEITMSDDIEWLLLEAMRLMDEEKR